MTRARKAAARAGTDDSDDELMCLIAVYMAGMEELDLDQELNAKRHSETIIKLNGWRKPLRTRAAAVAALKLAQYEVTNFSDSDTARAMITTVMAFLSAPASASPIDR